MRFDIDPRHKPDIVGTIVDMANVPDGVAATISVPAINATPAGASKVTP